MRSAYYADFNTSTYEYKNGLRHGKYKQCKYKFLKRNIIATNQAQFVYMTNI